MSHNEIVDSQNETHTKMPKITRKLGVGSSIILIGKLSVGRRGVIYSTQFPQMGVILYTLYLLEWP